MILILIASILWNTQACMCSKNIYFLIYLYVIQVDVYIIWFKFVISRLVYVTAYQYKGYTWYLSLLNWRVDTYSKQDQV